MVVSAAARMVADSVLLMVVLMAALKDEISVVHWELLRAGMLVALMENILVDKLVDLSDYYLTAM